MCNSGLSSFKVAPILLASHENSRLHTHTATIWQPCCAHPVNYTSQLCSKRSPLRDIQPPIRCSIRRPHQHPLSPCRTATWASKDPVFSLGFIRSRSALKTTLIIKWFRFWTVGVIEMRLVRVFAWRQRTQSWMWGLSFTSLRWKTTAKMLTFAGDTNKL